MLEKVLERAKELRAEIRRTGSSAIWFRGHRDATWDLLSALHRQINDVTKKLKKPWTAAEKRDLFREESKSAYRRFTAQAWPLLSSAERTEWGALFTMQHYRLPTRLLDWTESVLCALFFVQEHRAPGEASAVWVLDPERLNEATVGHRGLMALEGDITVGIPNQRQWHPRYPPPSYDVQTVAVAPVFTNPRMTAQRSVFTLSGDTFEPLDQQLGGRLLQDGIIARIDLPPETFDEANEYLRVAGVTAFTYFPDLEGLAMDHRARLEEDLRDAAQFFPGRLENREEQQ